MPYKHMMIFHCHVEVPEGKWLAKGGLLKLDTTKLRMVYYNKWYINGI